MTAGQWEALVERIGIIEYEGGLNRKAATLAAFALYFPGDYRAIKKAAAELADGETFIYEFVEGLLKQPETDTGGATVNAKTKKVLYGTAPDGPLMPRYEGLEAISYIAAHNIPLIGAYADGATIAKQEPGNFTTNPAEIAAIMKGQGNRHGKGKGTAIERFYFIPADAGLLCLDIDRKPGKPDGLQEFYKLFPKDILPRELQDIDRFFPCHVTTPSGGYHLYFRYNGPPVKKNNLAPEVEIKHGRPGLTAPGSRKENGAYVLHGNLADAPPLYGLIIERIAELQKQKEARVDPSGKPERTAADRAAPRHMWGNPGRQRITLDILADEAAAAYSGHHDRQVCFAGKACRCKFSGAETLEHVRSNPNIFGTDADTENTILSVFRDNGGV